MSNPGDRPLGGFGVRSERGAWAVTLTGVVLTVAAVVMTFVDSEPAVWLTTVAFLLLATGFGLYCLLWFRRRARRETTRR